MSFIGSHEVSYRNYIDGDFDLTTPTGFLTVKINDPCAT